MAPKEAKPSAESASSADPAGQGSSPGGTDDRQPRLSDIPPSRRRGEEAEGQRLPKSAGLARSPLRVEGGLAALATGGLIFLGDLFNLGASSGAGTVSGTGLTLAAYALAPLAFAGLQARQEKAGGVLGRIGTVVVIVGAVLVAAITFVEFAQASGIDVGLVLQAPGARWVSSFGALVFILGVLLFGASVVRGRVLPAGGGITLMVGTIVFSAATLSLGAAGYVKLVGGAITGFGFIRLGAALLAPPSRGS